VDEAERILDEVAEPFRQTWEQRYLRELCRRKARPLVGHTDRVNCVGISADGKIVVTGSADKTVKVWDAATGKELLTLKHKGAVLSVAISADGQRIVSASDETAKVWDAATGKELLTLKHEGAVLSVAISGNGKHIVTGGLDGTVKLWDAATGAENRVFKGHNGRVITVAISAEGRRVVSAAATDGEPGRGDAPCAIKVWDAATGKETLTLPGPPRELAGKHLVAISADGRFIALGNKVLEAATGQEKLTLPEARVSGVAFSADGKHLITATRDNGAVKARDAVTGQEELSLGVEVRRRLGPHGGNFNLAISGDGRRVVVCRVWNNSSARVWDTATTPVRWTLSRVPPCAAFSADGRHILCPTLTTLWDAASGRKLLEIPVPGETHPQGGRGPSGHQPRRPAHRHGRQGVGGDADAARAAPGEVRVTRTPQVDDLTAVVVKRL
jgi:WD40 repeat protein